MKPDLISRLILLLAILAILPSCERLFDKEAHYSYRIVNKTNTPVEVVVAINPGTRVEVIGDPLSSYILPVGGTIEVWATSGFATDEVYDEEKKNTELYWISVAVTSNGRPSRSNLNSAARWKFEKRENYKAHYTLTLTENDF